MESKATEAQLEDAKTLSAALSVLAATDPMVVKSIEMSGSEFHNRELINWRRARAVIEHENMLVNHRVTWLFVSQGVILTACVQMYQRLDAGLSVPLAILAALGPLVCFNLYFQIKNAGTQMSRVTAWWYSAATDKPEEERKAIYRGLNRAHPPLHFWRDTEKLAGEKGELSHNATFRVEALALYFLVVWILLISSVVIQHTLPAWWTRVTEAFANGGLSFAGGAVVTAVVFLLFRIWRSDRPKVHHW